MRKLTTLISLIALASVVALKATAEQPVTKEITIAVSDVFVPEVVEKEKEAKIVLSGVFPNSCYRWSRAEVSDLSDTFHVIQAKAFVTVNMICRMVLVPYSKEVNLGSLVPGEHTLRFVSGDETYFERKLTVD